MVVFDYLSRRVEQVVWMYLISKAPAKHVGRRYDIGERMEAWTKRRYKRGDSAISRVEASGI